MANLFDNPITASDPEGVQVALANTVEKRYRDDHGSIYWTEFQKFDPMQVVEKPVHNDQLVVGLTGIGSGGIGQAKAFEYSVKRKHLVVCCDRDGSRAESAVGEIADAGGQICFVEADVSTQEGVTRFMEEIEKQAGRLDVLDCHAGSAGDPKRDTIRDLSLPEFRELIDSNLTSTFLTTQAALNFFFERQQSGTIVLMGSMNGQPGRAFMNQLSYGMAKCAVSALLSHLVLHFGAWLKVLLVRVGPVRTNSENWQKRLQIDPRWEEIEGMILNPTGRLTRPDEVAKTVAWLTFDSPDHLTGVEINLDGGFSAVGLNIGTKGRESIVKLGQLLDADRQPQNRKAA